jgi:uncharacterized repeat protein (TIGR02543 family)
MKTTSVSKKRHYLEGVGIFLVMSALITAAVGCDEYIPSPHYQHSFSLSVSSTMGGSVTVPGEGTYSAGEGEMVTLVAEPDDGYEFVGWTGNAGTIDDAHAASTTITMQDDYRITANFGKPPPPTIWPLILRVIVGAVALGVGLGIFFRRRKRSARANLESRTFA